MAHSGRMGHVWPSTWTGAQEHHLGCLWNFRSEISLCVSSADVLNGNRYGNWSSVRAARQPLILAWKH